MGIGDTWSIQHPLTGVMSSVTSGSKRSIGLSFSKIKIRSVVMYSTNQEAAHPAPKHSILYIMSVHVDCFIREANAIELHPTS
jgi:hypothetical protein